MTDDRPRRRSAALLIAVLLFATSCAGEPQLTALDNEPTPPPTTPALDNEPEAATPTATAPAAASPTFEPQPPRPTTTANDEPSFRFVSIPDFLNNDIDMSGTIPGGSPPEMVEVVNFVLDAIAEEQPAFVLVAGDLMNSRWHIDRPGDEYFGPVDTQQEQQAAIDAAAAIYYPAWRDMFAVRDLVVFPAMGDHELGDNDWPAGSDKSALVPSYRSNFAQYLLDASPDDRLAATTLFDGQATTHPIDSQWERSAYAFVNANTLFVSLDVFRQDDPSESLDERTGSVLATVSGAQLAWLRSLFEAARASGEIDHIMVQGHTPVLTPVRFKNSSELYLRDEDGDTGAATDLWKLFSEYDVAMYMSGEVHDISTSYAENMHQFVNGAVVGLNPRINYLVVDVWEDRLEVTAKEIRVVRVDDAMLWSTSDARSWVVRLRNSAREDGFVTVGSVTLRRGPAGYSAEAATGVLECFGTCDQ